MAVVTRTGDRPELRTSGVLAAAAASVLLFSCLIVPVLGALGVMVSPLPIIVQRLRRGLGSALLTALLASSAVAVLFAPGQALAYLLLLVAPGLLIGESMAHGRGLVRGCGWAFTAITAEIGALLLVAGPSLARLALAPLDDSASPAALEALRDRGLDPLTVEALAEQTRQLHSVLSVVYPAAFVIMGALVVLANAALLRAYLASRDPGWLEGGEFESIRWPLGLAVVFVLAGAAVLAPPLRPTAYNALLLVTFFFALQGLAVIAYYTHRLPGPPLLRIGLLVLVLINPWAPQLLALLGLFDTWFDFRRWADPPAEEE